MELVVDANVFFSALIKKNVTRKLLLSNKVSLLTPEFILDEMYKYLHVLSTKTKLSEEQLKELIEELFVTANIRIVPFSEFKSFLKEAEKISPDSKDAHYFALALKFKCGIWSNDKKLKEQDRIEVYSTDDLVFIL